MESKHKEEFVLSVFEKIAPKYDLMNDILSFRRHQAWRAFTMKRMNVQPGQTAIDLCCGTCAWTIPLAQASLSGRIIGLDFSRHMLDFGQQKVNQLALQEQIELIQGNAMAIPYPDDSFDFATIGFGLRNVPDIVQVLKEMQRVVKPGGKVVCLELSKPTKQPFKAVYYGYFRYILPLLGKLLAKSYDQYQWLPKSLASFPDYEQLAITFKQVGLVDVEVHPLTGGVAALHIGTKRTTLEVVTND